MKKSSFFLFLFLCGFVAPDDSIFSDPKTIESKLPSGWGPCDPRSIHSYKPVQKVYVVTFAGWDEDRYQNALLLAERVRARGYIPLVYTEKDLPPEYYNDFSWAYAKPQYRGFWTWKPWMLRNLTETLLNDGDILFWMDSDRMIEDTTILGTTASAAPYDYFNVMLCNLEHRTHNDEGILAFQRCHGHIEEKFTKPEVFSIMNVSKDEYGMGEQLYAGAIGFKKKTPNTLDFLQQWQDWGNYYPITFGNDSFRNKNFTRPQNYKGHRHDQSVFSLMVRTRTKIELWPAPYFAFDSGIKKEKCLDRFQNAGYCVFFPDSRLPDNELSKACKPFTHWLNTLPAISS